MKSAAILRAEAVELEQRAARLRKHAEEIEEQRAWRKEREWRKRTIRNAAYATVTRDFDTVAKELGRELGSPGNTAALVLSNAISVMKGVAKAQRNRLIMQLAWRGWTNKKIAEDPRINLAEKTVSRIVAGRLCGLEANSVNEAMTRLWRQAEATKR